LSGRSQLCGGLRRAFVCAFLIPAALHCGGCAKAVSLGEITVAGSDVMVILSQKWAEDYTAKNKRVSVRISGGGSEKGFAALIQGKLDICQSSRPILPEEAARLKRRCGVEAREFAVARDGIVIYVNGDNRVKTLTLSEVRGLFTGKIDDWRNCGGKTGKVTLYGPRAASWTARQFRDAVLGSAELSPNLRELEGTAGIIAAVGGDPGGVGFGGMGYASKARAVALRTARGKPAVEPSLKTFGDGTYPLMRELFYYTAGDPRAEVEKFLKWAMSEAGRQSARAAGYFALRG
jgi:phosphate transport system substrate-binding protein